MRVLNKTTENRGIIMFTVTNDYGYKHLPTTFKTYDQAESYYADQVHEMCANLASRRNSAEQRNPPVSKPKKSGIRLTQDGRLIREFIICTPFTNPPDASFLLDRLPVIDINRYSVRLENVRSAQEAICPTVTIGRADNNSSVTQRLSDAHRTVCFQQTWESRELSKDIIITFVYDDFDARYVKSSTLASLKPNPIVHIERFYDTPNWAKFTCPAPTKTCWRQI